MPARAPALGWCALALSGLAGCAGGSAAISRYVGPSPACPGGGGPSATLVRHGPEFALAPADGAVVVRGTVAADGSLAGSLVLRPGRAKPSAPPPSAPPSAGLALAVEGRLTADAAVVDYAAGACHATLHLSRVTVPLL